MTDRTAYPGSRALFVTTLLTGSFLLFLMQPLVARMALPRLGGAPAVWNSAMLVYQALLLVGYAYADALGRLRPRIQALVHLAVFAISALWLPVGLAQFGQPAGTPTELWVPWLLAASIGPLFVAVAAQAPLMQRWYVLRGQGGDPYWLYAASNIGSFAGLLAYPLLFEPLLSVREQARGWSIGFVLLAALMASCAVALWRTRSRPAHPELAEGCSPAARSTLRQAQGEREACPHISWRCWLRWTALSAVPSGLMLSTTTRLTTDIGAVPLLWVVPLGLYLLSFSIAFSHSRAGARIAWTLPLALVIAALGAASSAGAFPLLFGAANLLLLFLAAVALHRALYLARPEPAQLTRFYLALSIGGALGGFFCAIVAPVLFDWTYEHPLLLLAAALLARPRGLTGGLRRFWAEREPRLRRMLIVALAAIVLANLGSGLFLPTPPEIDGLAIGALMLLALACAGRRWLFALCVACELLAAGGWRTLAISVVSDARTRSYFGVYTMIDRKDVRDLISGTTLHGRQLKRRGLETFPTSYYAPRSGIGMAMAAVPGLYGPHATVGVVGLGSGTLACYREAGQDWRFYEIDPAVLRLAADPKRFTFLARCAPHVPVELGDARLTLAARPHPKFDLLAIDAFSSDAVPTHLLTLEAFALYRRALAPNGLLLVHVSNRFMDLSKVVAAAARAQGWQAALRDYRPTAAEQAAMAGRSIWIALSPDRLTFDALVYGRGKDDAWLPLNPTSGFRPWTDDHMSVLTVLRLHPY